ncbi:hypothetical protein [Motiliproteus sp. SC1-56]|uniref:lipoate--protein ligase family protein n=1 Tax=Motiliproteus sp. SC1-56 TaxID=2799565 RepID=UPI001A8DF5CD|nr:hypothetical protein [Motiliproteus sp. SC1-56]
MSLDPFFTHHRPWRWIEEPLGEAPGAALARDTQLVQALARGEGTAVARLWENPRCLVVTRRETRLPQFEAACRLLADEGWPVIVRESGGTAVPHGPGILHFSLVFAQHRDGRYDLDQAYQALCEPLRGALSALGLKTQYGAVAGAYCDGRYNLNIDGLKVTGTAQRLIAARAKGIKNAVLAQAMLMVESDAAAGTEQVNRFYRLAGDSRHYDPTVSTSVAERLRAAGRPTEGLTQQVRGLIKESWQHLTSG